MQGRRLSGTVEPGPRRDTWILIVNLPSQLVLDEEGRAVYDARGRLKRRYPKKTKQVAAKGKKAAERLLGDWIDELEERASTQDLTLGEMCRRFLERAPDRLRPKTVKFYRDNIRLHIVPALGGMLAAEVTDDDVHALLKAKKEAGLSDTSCRHVWATMSAVYTWAMRAPRHYVTLNPVALAEHKPQQTRPEMVTWSQDDIVLGVVAAGGDPDSRWHGQRTPQLVYIPQVLAAWGGLREGEVCALRWDFVDFAKGGVFVDETIEQVEEGRLHWEEPKTEASRAFVPMPSQAMEILAQHKAAQDEFRLAAGKSWNREGYVVCRRDGQPVKPSTLASAWSRFCRVHRLPKITFHGLRHSFVTNILEQGGNDKERMLKLAQMLARHADPATTVRIYFHPTQASQDLVIARTEAAIEAAREKAGQDSRVSREKVTDLAARRRKKLLQNNG